MPISQGLLLHLLMGSSGQAWVATLRRKETAPPVFLSRLLAMADGTRGRPVTQGGPRSAFLLGGCSWASEPPWAASEAA